MIEKKVAARLFPWRREATTVDSDELERKEGNEAREKGQERGRETSRSFKKTPTKRASPGVRNGNWPRQDHPASTAQHSLGTQPGPDVALARLPSLPVADKYGELSVDSFLDAGVAATWGCLVGPSVPKGVLACRAGYHCIHCTQQGRANRACPIVFLFVSEYSGSSVVLACRCGACLEARRMQLYIVRWFIC